MEGEKMKQSASGHDTFSTAINIVASCHCGAIKLEVEPVIQDTAIPKRISLCHCNTCRHATGLLCTSYLPIAKPKSLQLLTMRAFGDGKSQRYFCSNCGCHVFRSRSNSVLKSSNDIDNAEHWEVATGVLNYVMNHVQIGSHVHVSDTKDGGLSSWVVEQNLEPLRAVHESASSSGQGSVKFSPTREDITIKTTSGDSSSLQASCACGTVRFHVTRPDASSKVPKSSFPDLMIPYHTQDPSIQNSGNETWWLRSGDTKYLAGTCACRSCRLTSGFEIQAWAFIPRSNIYFHISKIESSNEFSKMALDFRELPSGILYNYESSSGVVREFCGTCGATVFWHDKWRPELVDVSVGLFKAEEGARAENWLEWWTERVSFEEDAAIDRVVKDGDSKFDLIPGLRRGLLAWGKSNKPS